VEIPTIIILMFWKVREVGFRSTQWDNGSSHAIPPTWAFSQHCVITVLSSQAQVRPYPNIPQSGKHLHISTKVERIIQSIGIKIQFLFYIITVSGINTLKRYQERVHDGSRVVSGTKQKNSISPFFSMDVVKGV
jgi:hypothetical protein